MEYVKAIPKSELPENQKRILSIRGKEILLINDNGSFYAINNKCTHLGGSLGNGELSGNIITCPKHGAKFDVRTGKNVGEAKMGFLKLNVKDEEIYPTKVEGTDILIGLP